jgi:MFS family permease
MTMALGAITYLDRVALSVTRPDVARDLNLSPTQMGYVFSIGGRRAGAVSAAMNTSGQVGSILSPILVAAVVQRSAQWSAPLYLAGVLFLLGARCWLWVDATKPVSE